MNYFFETRGNDIMAKIFYTLDFDAHLHGHIEMGYIISGRSDLYIEDKKYPIKSGDFFIIFPHQVHRYENSEGIKTYIMIFPPSITPEFSHVFLQSIPKSPTISADSATKQLIDLLFKEYGHLSAEAVRGFILSLLGMLFERINFTAQDKYNISTLKNILIYCDEHFTDHISIDDAAEELHISRSHISHVFKQKLRTTFGKYICDKRISYACGLLKNTSLSVTDTAFASGFDSVRTFNRAFLNYTGSTPREYRKNKGRPMT